MNWFKKHLHYTWLICLGVLLLIAAFVPSLGSIFAFLGMLVVDGWILRQKNRNMWWLLVCILIWTPLVLSNENEVKNKQKTLNSVG